MKRFLAISFIISLLFTGCSKQKEPTIPESTEDTAEVIQEITDDNKLPEPEAIFDSIQSGVDKLNIVDSYSCKSNMNIKISSNDSTMESNQNYDISCTKSAYSFNINTEEKSSLPDTDPMSSNLATDGFIQGDTLYYNIAKDGETAKLKESMKVADFAEEMKPDIVYTQLERSYISEAAMEDFEGGKIYLANLGGEDFNNYITEMLQDEENTATESLDIKNASINVHLDKDGNLINYKVNFTISITDEDESVAEFKMTMDSNFSDYNNVTIEEKSEDDLADYIDVKEYFAAMETTTEAAE